MEKVVNKLEHSKVEVVVSVDKAAWSDAKEKAFKKLAANVTVKGFRKGKAPIDLAKKKIDPNQVLDDAINSLLPSAYEEALKDTDIHPFEKPTVDVSKLSDDGVDLKFTILCVPEVTLGKYKGLHIDKKEIKVSKKDVENAIKELQKQNAALNVKEEAAAIGDTVVMDFEGFVGGVAFDGGKAENYSLELGSNQFIPGFEEQLVGLKANDTKEITVKFPDNYVENLKGKEAMFKILVHEVKAKVLPELNDEFVVDANIKDVKTLAELEAYEEKVLKDKKVAEEEKRYYEELVKLIREDAKVDLAKEIVESEVSAMKENMEKQLSEQGLTMDQYLQITGQTLEKVHDQMAKDAELNLKSVLCLQQIAKVEDIKVLNSDIDARIQAIATQYAMEVEKVKEILTKDMSRLANDIQNQKIHDYLIANNN